MLAYPTDICVGCCGAVPGKFRKQLAVPQPHNAFHLSWIRLMGNAVTSTSERKALLVPSQPLLHPLSIQATTQRQSAHDVVWDPTNKCSRQRRLLTTTHTNDPTLCWETEMLTNPGTVARLFLSTDCTLNDCWIIQNPTACLLWLRILKKKCKVSKLPLKITTKSHIDVSLFGKLTIICYLTKSKLFPL